MRGYADATSALRPSAGAGRRTCRRTTGEREAITHKVAPIASRAHNDRPRVHANHVTTASRRHHGPRACAFSVSEGSGPLPAVLEALLLGDGALGRRNHLEPLIGDRLAALDGEPVASVSQALLGPLDRRELVSKLVDAPHVDPRLVEV